MTPVKTDPVMNGIAMVFGSMAEAVDYTLKNKDKNYNPFYSSWDLGRRDLKTWDDVRKATVSPWQDGLTRVAEMTEELRQHVPAPTSVRRLGRWDDQEGEVDVDRCLKGEPLNMRRFVRQRAKSATQNVAVILHCGGQCRVTAEEIFWRGAATCAAVDLLEEAGYSCEVWTFNLNRHAFTRGPANQFYAVRVKECGDPLDTVTLVNACSAWMVRCIQFGAITTVPGYSSGLGATTDRLDDGWAAYMDVTTGITRVRVPEVFDKDSAVKEAKKLLETVTNPEGD